MKLLYYGETPYIETGAGQVSRHLLPVLHEFFDEIHVCAINQWWTQPGIPEWMTITQGTQEDLWASAEARRFIAAKDYDCLFLTTDLNRIDELYEEIRAAREAGIPVIMYAAMDCHIFHKHFWRVLKLASVAVVFSEWARRQAIFVDPDLESLRVIYHGCEPDVFYPLPEEERRALRQQFFGVGDETFVVASVNRNQLRKDLARAMAAFHLFHLDSPDSLLYMHCKQSDLGGHLPSQAIALGLSKQEIVFAPPEYHESGGLTRSDLNKIYNAADVCISTSTGEGWGLTTTEAMAAGVPFIGPDNSVFPEQLGNFEMLRWEDRYFLAERGILVESGGPDLWFIPYGVSDTPRELCSTTGMKQALSEVRTYPESAKQRAQAARAWTLQHTWQHKQEQWRALLQEVTGATSQREVEEGDLLKHSDGAAGGQAAQAGDRDCPAPGGRTALTQGA